MRKKFIISLLFLLTLSLINTTSFVYADKIDSNKQSGGYTVEGVPNDHQIDPSLGYFYLEESPGEKDSLKIRLINSSNQDKVLEVKVTDANTNINGDIDYTGQLKNDSSLKVPLTSIIHDYKKEVVVSKHSSKEVTLNLQMPQYKLEGIVLGGVVVSEKEEKQEKHTGLSLGNTYSYTIGIVLTNDKKTLMNKNVSLKLQKVDVILFDGRKIVQADLLNPNPYIFSQVTISGEIINQKNNKVVNTRKIEKVKIAPYSIFPFQFDWNKEELKPGKYLFKGVAQTKDKTWNFRKEFEIKEETAKKINNASVFKVRVPFWTRITCFLLAILSLTNFIVLIIRTKRLGGRRDEK